MSARVLSALLAVVLVAAAVQISGCARRAPGEGAAATSPSAASEAQPATQSVVGGVPATGSPGSSVSGTTSLDTGAIDRQLEKMQKEIDNLAMPADSDFDGVQGAIY